jgi:NAD(P)-dependent dehydrogenase (short-subunit alcohol dehydrogenase family)
VKFKNMGKLSNRVIIITGATSGMGKAMAKLFAQEGAKLVLAGRNEAKGSVLKKELIKINPDIIFESGDISLPKTNESLVALAIKNFGKIDTIIANAGTLGLGKVTDLTIESWHQTLNTNLSSLFYLSKYAIPHMLENKFGVILANASIAAFKAFPQHPAYCASKAGQLALVKQIATDYGPDIRANGMCPGPIDTPLIWDSAKAFKDPDKAVRNAANATLLNKLGTPEEVAKLALFLISDDASFITGSAFNIDGGILAQ